MKQAQIDYQALRNRQNQNIFQYQASNEQSQVIVEENQLKNISHEDSISIYLQKSAKCSSDDDNDDSFIVQQVQDQNNSTNQIQQSDQKYDYEQHALPTQKKVQKKKTFKKTKKISKSKSEFNFQQTKNNSRKYKLERKVRVSINQDKFQQMQSLFQESQKSRYCQNSRISLKQISRFLNLGYSTVLHKYRQFRQCGQIQKGVLLQCKDIKRKYKKSQEIQSKIIQALKVKSFKTAIQLSKFLQENYGIKVTRSIVSRHLNQMKNQNIEADILKKKKIREQKIEKTLNLKPFNQYRRQTKYMSLNQRNYYNKFKKIIITLREQNIPTYFFQNFNIVLMDKKVYFESDIDEILSSYARFQVLMISLASNGDQIVDFNFQIISSYQASRSSQSLKNFIYLYVKEKMTEFTAVRNSEKNFFFVSNFKANQQQRVQRQKLYKLAEQKNVDIMFMPPDTEALNFIRKWFYEKVFSQIYTIMFNSVQKLKEKVIQLSVIKQNQLNYYSKEMYQKIKAMN